MNSDEEERKKQKKERSFQFPFFFKNKKINKIHYKTFGCHNWI